MLSFLISYQTVFQIAVLFYILTSNVSEFWLLHIISNYQFFHFSPSNCFLLQTFLKKNKSIAVSAVLFYCLYDVFFIFVFSAFLCPNI